jgi:hypothetical protein
MCLSGRTCADLHGLGSVAKMFIVVPMADYSANNKTVSDKIREGNDRPYTSYVIVVRFGFVIGKTP